MDTIFRIFMYLLPYALSVAGYIWIAKKAVKVPNKAAKIIAIIILAGGFGYTLYKMARSITTIFTNDNFEFVIIIVNVFVLFFASIAITMGEPEKEEGK